jgi:2-polyprenyl-3-methyl-5-hydroxy-6-metoxy-1,4-benzoquinol methylase
MNDLLNKESHFAFGKNWLDYASKIDEDKINQAMADLQRLNSGSRFDGLSFLDIGCGSGLHALAAIRLGASRVRCVDIDADSVIATRGTLAKFAPDFPAVVSEDSVFNMTPESHGRFDVVYSWGVLHHTGDMFRAMELASQLVAEHGVFMIALYRKTPFCGMWRILKKHYANSSLKTQKKMMHIYLVVYHSVARLVGIDIKSKIAGYDKSRGMDYYNDIHDWLGGYPYQSIAPEQCIEYFSERRFIVDYSNIKKASKSLGIFGSGCDEFTFKRT